jgi:hypothetical protein
MGDYEGTDNGAHVARVEDHPAHRQTYVPAFYGPAHGGVCSHCGDDEQPVRDVVLSVRGFRFVAVLCNGVEGSCLQLWQELGEGD